MHVIYGDSRGESARCAEKKDLEAFHSINSTNFIKQLLCTVSVIQTIVISRQRETINPQIYIISSGKDVMRVGCHLNKVPREGLSDKRTFSFSPKHEQGSHWKVLSSRKEQSDHI